MKQLFDDVSFKCSKLVTKNYSTFFTGICYHLLEMPFIASMVLFALRMKFDSFHGYDKESFELRV
jgi:hypothetical protein